MENAQAMNEAIMQATIDATKAEVQAMAETAGLLKEAIQQSSHQALTPEAVDKPWKNQTSTRRSKISITNHFTL